MQATHYQKRHASTTSAVSESLCAGIPLDYEVIPFGIHRTTINRLAIILTSALTTDDQRKSQGHELRHKCMIATFDYVIYALGFQMLNRPCCRWISSRIVLRRLAAVASRPRRSIRARCLTHPHLRQRIQYGLSQKEQH